MNEHLIQIKELQPIAARMRDRQEQIEESKRDVYGRIGNLINLATTQGRDCLLAKTKLGKSMSWPEWIKAHVPNITLAEASKYERITCEQLSDVRQCVFAFLPETPKQQTQERTKPKTWERVFGWVTNLRKTVTPQEIKEWPNDVVHSTRKEMEPIARALWPERF